MKISFILILFVTLFGINSFAGTEYDPNGYCSFARILEGSSITLQEEFAMLLEPRWTPNYQAITKAVAVLAIAPPEDLSNPKCPIYNYAREFLNYYNKNKEEITEDKLYITRLLDVVQKRVEEIDLQKTKPHKWWIF